MVTVVTYQFSTDNSIDKKLKICHQVESDPVIPLDWDKMDAILLKGPYRTVLDEIQQRFAEISLEIVHTSEVILRDEESTSMILWITSDPDEDEAFIESVDNIVKEAIHNSLNENHKYFDFQNFKFNDYF